MSAKRCPFAEAPGRIGDDDVEPIPKAVQARLPHRKLHLAVTRRPRIRRIVHVGLPAYAFHEFIIGDDRVAGKPGHATFLPLFAFRYGL